MTEADENAYLRTQFLERVAHELRGPAGVTLGALAELEAALGDRAAEFAPLLLMARRGVNRIVRSAERLQQTGQLSAHRADFSRLDVDVAPLVARAVSEAESLEARRKVQVQVDAPSSPVTCAADARWVSVALFEVISNAIRHARQLVQVRAERAGDAFVVTVTDDGPGTDEFRPLRFEAPRERRGLGLSLAIVRDVVEAHDGTLAVEQGRTSGASFGSRVRLTFPLAAPGRATSEGP